MTDRKTVVSGPRLRVKKGKPTISGSHRNSHVEWPTLANPTSMAALSLQLQLDDTERWPIEKITEHQLRQIQQLITHAAKYVPLYRDRLTSVKELKLGALTMSDFTKLPVLTRSDLQSAGRDAMTVKLPAGHSPTHEVSTSGSTGLPITAITTRKTAMFNRAMSYRAHRWQGRDPYGSYASMRPLSEDERSERRSWSWLPNSGPSIRIKLNQPLETVLRQLLDLDPHYLQTRPGVLLELVRLSEQQRGKPVGLIDATTFGECLTEEMRGEIETAWDIKIYNNYSAMEIGLIASQCAEAGKLHVQSEHVLCEVVDDLGQPVEVGEVGKVVVTALQNYGGPLIRYAIGDYARMGTVCNCGRTLPVIEEIMGRYRSALVLPNGERRFPTSINGITRLAPIKQFQVRQTAATELRLSLHMERALTAAEERAIRQYFADRFEYDLNIRLNYVDEMIRRPGDKYEEFVSDLS